MTTVDLEWDGRMLSFDVARLETAWLAYQDAEGDGIARKAATARLLCDLGWQASEAIAYSVAVTKWTPPH